MALAFRPHLIHVFKPKGYSGLAAMLLIMLKKIRLVDKPVVVDSDDWEGYGGFATFYLEHSMYPRIALSFFDFQEKWITRRANSLTVASKMLEKQANAFHIPSRNVFYVPNGLHLDPNILEELSKSKRSEKEDTSTILLYTRFFEYNTKKVIDIMSKVRKKLKSARLLVIGKGMFHEEEDLLHLAKEQEIEKALTYVGWIQSKDIPHYLALADVAIYPYDNTLLNKSKCPGKLVELMTAGKAIVAENVGQIGEYIVDGESGLLVTPGDSEMFAQKIVRMLKDKQLREKLGENARRRIKSYFSWDRLIINVEEAYHAALGNLKSEGRKVMPTL
jgi:glycosyltransferase involved in cell wall biosynthesis